MNKLHSFLLRSFIAILLTVGIAIPSFVPQIVKAATIRIAASNSSSGNKLQATVVCTGTHDDNAINPYLVAGNIVELFAGTYNINGTLAFDSNLRLYGQGNTTIINLQSNYIDCYNDSNVEIDHLELTGIGGGSAIIINATTTNITNYNIHDIYCNATASNDFEVYLAGYQASNFIFSNVDANTPDGNGFCNFATGDTGNVINNFTYYKCSVENAGVASSRIGNWITGFDVGENIVVGHETYITIQNSYYINCTVNGAWESDYHMEYGTTNTNVVFTGCDAQNAGRKPVPDAGYGFKTNPTSEAIEYQNTASANTGGDLYLNGTTYTPIVNGISPTGSSKVAQVVSQGNCRGVIITTSANTYELVLYTSNGSSVSQTLTLPNSNTYYAGFTSYAVYTGINGTGSTIKPSVTTGSYSNVTVSSADIYESVIAIGSSDVTTWGTDYNSSVKSTIGDHNGTFNWTDSLTGLSPATLYSYNGFATNSVGTGSGSTSSFLTLPTAPTAPSATAGNQEVLLSWTKATPGTGTQIYTDVQYNPAASGYPATYTAGTQWGTGWTTASSGTVTGLTNGTAYDFSIFTKAVNGSLTTYSVAYASVTATPTAPLVVSTINLSAVTSNTGTAATLNGSVTLTGGDNPTITVYWGTSDGVQVPGNWTNNSVPTTPSQPQSVGAFTLNITGLTAGTTYYYSARAVNSAGTSWVAASGSFVAATAATNSPSVSTGSANVNGDVVGSVSNVGSSPVTSYGFIWGTTTAYGNPVVTITQTQVNSFTFDSYLAPIVAGTTYYYKAFATNSVGTTYGNPSQFTVPITSNAPAQPDAGTGVITAEAFQNIYQDGDILIIFEYNIAYTTIPSYPCSSLFYTQLMDSTTVLTPTHKPLNYYGYNMSAFYFSKVDVASLGIVWGTSAYKIEIDETSLFTPRTTFDYSLSLNTQWITEPDMTLAQGDVQTYILTSVVGGSNGIQANSNPPQTYIVNTSDTSALNAAGRTLVLSAIPFLDTPIPQLFQLSTQAISETQPVSVGSLQTNLTLQQQLGTQISSSFDSLGTLLHISGQQVALGWILVCILILIGIVFLATGNLIGASIVALPMVLIGVWIGAVPVAFIFVGTMVIVVLLSFYLFIRGM